MTICIAAMCLDHGKPAIALCADTKQSFYEGLTNSGGSTKFWMATEGWCALVSGPVEYAKRLVWECGKFIKENEKNLKHTTIQKQLQTPLKEWRRFLLDEAAGKFGISYDEFLAGSVKEKTLLRDLNAAFKAVGAADYGVIFTGFIDHLPVIAKIENGIVSTSPSFALTGSGCFLASVPLCERDIGASGVPVEHAAYMIYEAKRFSEKDSNVNDKITMCIQHEWDRGSGQPASKALEWLPESALKKLESMYKSLGLQPLITIPPRDILLS